MGRIFDYIRAEWLNIIIPLAVFVFALIAMFWLRRELYRRLKSWFDSHHWEAGRLLLPSLKVPTVFWDLLISAYIALSISVLPDAWKTPFGNGLWTLFVVSVSLTAMNLVNSLLTFYGQRMQVPDAAMNILRNATRIVILIVMALGILQVWGVQTSPFLFLALVILLVALVTFREAAPNLMAWFQISANQHIKVNDYIKLASGEEGYVTQIGWNNTRLRSLDGSVIIVPNSRLLQRTVTNYGHPLKKAKDAFRFYDHVLATELTGLKAKNLRELHDILATAPDSMVYFHTHHFIESHNYLTPGFSNDFASWVTDALGNEVLGERLSAIDTFEFNNLSALRERLTSIMAEGLATDSWGRDVIEGREFYFMKSVSVIYTLPYVAQDLRELIEALRQVSLSSLYFHIFEARLRLGRGLNDFTAWLRDSLDETELSDEISRLDPYTYSLEGLRSALIQLIEKRVK